MARFEPRLTPQKIVAVERRDERLLTALVPVFERAGWEPRVVDDLRMWASRNVSPVSMLTLKDEDDWRRLERLTEQGEGIVMALLPHPRPALYRRALLAGASAVAAMVTARHTLGAFFSCDVRGRPGAHMAAPRGKGLKPHFIQIRDRLVADLDELAVPGGGSAGGAPRRLRGR